MKSNAIDITLDVVNFYLDNVEKGKASTQELAKALPSILIQLYGRLTDLYLHGSKLESYAQFKEIFSAFVELGALRLYDSDRLEDFDLKTNLKDEVALLLKDYPNLLDTILSDQDDRDTSNSDG